MGASQFYPFAGRLSGLATLLPGRALANLGQKGIECGRLGHHPAIELLQSDLKRMLEVQPGTGIVEVAGRLMEDTNGNIHIDEAAQRIGVSRRHLERHFKYWLGVTPKAYARLLRYQSVREHLMRNPFNETARLAQLAGYSPRQFLRYVVPILSA